MVLRGNVLPLLEPGAVQPGANCNEIGSLTSLSESMKFRCIQ